MSTKDGATCEKRAKDSKITVIEPTINKSQIVPFIKTSPNGHDDGHVEDAQELNSMSHIESHQVPVGCQKNGLEEEKHSQAPMRAEKHNQAPMREDKHTQAPMREEKHSQTAMS